MSPALFSQFNNATNTLFHLKISAEGEFRLKHIFFQTNAKG